MNEDRSKSKARRDALALKALGQELLTLSPKQLEKLPIPSVLLEAIDTYRKIKSHLAQKRHVQYVANVLRHLPEESLAHVQSEYTKMRSSADLNSPEFRRLERWRTRLIEEDSTALTDFLEQHPGESKQALRQLIRKAKADALNQRDTGASKALFRFLREWVS